MGEEGKRDCFSAVSPNIRNPGAGSGLSPVAMLVSKDCVATGARAT